MKKKILTLCLVVALAATAVIGGTLAYFTDTDAETNVFTTGKVDIDLVETFDTEDGSKDNKVEVFPGKQNATQKEVKITLDEDSEDAYVWYTYAVPRELDYQSAAYAQVIQVNMHGRTWDTYASESKYWIDGQTAALTTEYTWDYNLDDAGKIAEYHNNNGNGWSVQYNAIGSYKDDKGVIYNVYLCLYHGKLSNADDGQTETTVSMKDIRIPNGVDTYKENGEVVANTYVDESGDKFTFAADGVKVIVKAYAVQAEGFADVYEAYLANPVQYGTDGYLK